MEGSNVRMIVLESGNQQSEDTQSCSTSDQLEMTNGEEYKNRYDFGFRQMGDLLIDRKEDGHFWDTENNVEVKLRCSSKVGYIISHVDIQMDHSSDKECGADIVAGGTGTSFLEVVIKACDTRWLRYNAKFYGREVKME